MWGWGGGEGGGRGGRGRAPPPRRKVDKKVKESLAARSVLAVAKCGLGDCCGDIDNDTDRAKATSLCLSDRLSHLEAVLTILPALLRTVPLALE